MQRKNPDISSEDKSVEYTVSQTEQDNNYDKYSKHICVCCGKCYVNFCDICDICGWQDDILQNKKPDYKGGANQMSLNEAKAAFAKGEKII